MKDEKIVGENLKAKLHSGSEATFCSRHVGFFILSKSIPYLSDKKNQFGGKSVPTPGCGGQGHLVHWFPQTQKMLCIVKLAKQTGVSYHEYPLPGKVVPQAKLAPPSTFHRANMPSWPSEVIPRPKHAILVPLFPCIYVTEEVGLLSPFHFRNKQSWPPPPPKNWPMARTSHPGGPISPGVQLYKWLWKLGTENISHTGPIFSEAPVSSPGVSNRETCNKETCSHKALTANNKRRNVQNNTEGGQQKNIKSRCLGGKHSNFREPNDLVYYSFVSPWFSKFQQKYFLLQNHSVFVCIITQSLESFNLQ